MKRTYDYPAHNAIRAAWMHYLPPIFEASSDHILYLAGPENLELPGYLAKGLRPSQLTTAEHDKEIYPLVLANSGGVHVTSGGIQTAVEEMISRGIVRLRGAWLDFDGNAHSYTEELLALARLMPSQGGSSLGVTSYSARDRHALVQGTINAAKFYSGLPSSGQFIREYGNMMRQFEHVLRLIPQRDSSPLAHFQREMGFLWWLTLMFGVVNPTKGSDPNVIDNAFLERSEATLCAITDEVKQRLGTQPRETDLVFVLIPRLRHMLASRRVKAWITHLERYAFWSANRQPMRVWFAKIQPLPRGQPAPTMQDLLEQVWTLAIRSPLIYIDQAGKHVTIE